jgi:hypothetical protein
LNLKYDEPLSKSAFKFSVRHYSQVKEEEDVLWGTMNETNEVGQCTLTPG